MPIKGLGRVFQGGASGKIDSLSTKLDALPGKPTVSQLYGFLDPNKGTKPRQLTFYLEKIRTLNLINHGLGENILRDFDQRVEQLTNTVAAEPAKETLFYLRGEMRGLIGKAYVEELKSAAQKGIPLAQETLELWAIEWDASLPKIEVSHTVPDQVNAGQRCKITIYAKEGSDFRKVNGLAVADEYDQDVQIVNFTPLTQHHGLRAEIEMKVEAHAPEGNLRIDLFADAEKTQKIGDFTIEIEPCKDQFFTVVKEKRKKSFVMVRDIGHGGMGQVYLVKDIDGNRYIAKVPLKITEDHLLRFRREIINLAKLSKHNIPHVMGYYGQGAKEVVIEGKKQSIPFFIAEYVEKNLKERIREIYAQIIATDEKGEVKQRMYFLHVLDLAKQLVGCLQVAYDACKIVHRDLSPADIRVAVVDNKSLLKVADFGQGRQIGEETEDTAASKDPSTAEMSVDTITKDTALVAKEKWVAPDVVRSGSWTTYEKKGIDPVYGDIYVVGLILHYMLTVAKQPPFRTKKFPDFQEGMTAQDWLKEWVEWVVELEQKIKDLDLRKDNLLRTTIPKEVFDDVINLLEHTITVSHETRYRYSKIAEKLERISLKLGGSPPPLLGAKEIVEKVSQAETDGDISFSLIIDATEDLSSFRPNDKDISDLQSYVDKVMKFRDSLPDQDRDKKAAYEEELQVAQNKLTELQQDHIPAEKVQAEVEHLINLKAEELELKEAQAEFERAEKLTGYFKDKDPSNPLLGEIRVAEACLYERIAILEGRNVSPAKLLEIEEVLAEAEERMPIITVQVSTAKGMLKQLQDQQGIHTKFDGVGVFGGKEGPLNLIEKGIFGITHKGIEKINQDGIAVAEREGEQLLLTADGIGGFAAGEEASKEAIEIIAVEWKKGRSLKEAFALACKRIKKHFPRRDTCLTAIKVSGNRAEIVTSGDVRTYLIKGDGTYILLQPGQNAVVEKIMEKHNLTSPLWGDNLKLLQKEFIQNKERHMVTASLWRSDEGNKAPITMETFLQEGDQLLVLTDGIYSILPQFDQTLKETIKSIKDPVKRAKRLKEAALAAMSGDHKDNISVMIYESRGKTDPITFINPKMLESHPDLVLLAIEGILAETIDIIAKNKEQVREFGQNVQEIYKILSKKEEEALTEIEQEIKLQTIELGQEIDEFVGSEGG